MDRMEFFLRVYEAAPARGAEEAVTAANTLLEAVEAPESQAPPSQPEASSEPSKPTPPRGRGKRTTH